MSDMTLHEITAAMVAPGKGILAIDESHGTCEKRFTALGVECNESTRQNYRQLLVTAPGSEEALSGMILFDETLRQKTDDGTPFVETLKSRGILPGIKVDTGAKDMALHPGEKITEGLDGLRERLAEYKQLGAQFAKWRAVITISDTTPTEANVYANCHALARYAALCQEAGMVPMVEPEILIDGDHDIETCQTISEEVWEILFEELDVMDVDLKGLILKTSMVINGKDSAESASIDEVATRTIESFEKVIPEDLAGIVFLSGGQTASQSTQHLNAMNAKFKNLPWPVSFSYGRGIQQPALELWGKDQTGNYEAAQKALTHRARMNGLAAKGEYTEDQDNL